MSFSLCFLHYWDNDLPQDQSSLLLETLHRLLLTSGADLGAKLAVFSLAVFAPVVSDTAALLLLLQVPGEQSPSELL